MKQLHNNYLGVRLLRYLVAEEGRRIFTSRQARAAAEILRVRPNYVAAILHYLERDGWVQRLKRGLYEISSESGFSAAPHEYEVATSLVPTSAISHWTAMHYHHLTDQIPNTVFALVPTGTAIPRSLDRRRYHYIQINPRFFFGFEKVWIEESQVLITGMERTLLDGLGSPQYCGDFQEVLHAFKVAKGKFNLETLIEYALRLDGAIIKRLGWILERLGYSDEELRKLLSLSIKGYRRLDPSRPLNGPHNKKWMIRENLGI